MPMTKAEVVATLASPLNAFKIINTTETVGAFTEDRASAILGRFGVDGADDSGVGGGDGGQSAAGKACAGEDGCTSRCWITGN